MLPWVLRPPGSLSMCESLSYSTHTRGSGYGDRTLKCLMEPTSFHALLCGPANTPRDTLRCEICLFRVSSREIC